MSGWIIKNRKPLFIGLFAVFCMVAAVLLVCFRWEIITVFLLAFIFFFIVYVFYYYLINERLKKGIEACEQHCDPEKFMQVTEELLSYGISGWIRQIVLIDYYDALRWLGQYEKSYELLKAVNIDKEAGTELGTKTVYYYNLADICTQIGKYDEANIWYDKMQQVYADIKNVKIKQMHEHMVICGQAYAYYRKGEYEKAVQTMSDLVIALTATGESGSRKIKKIMLIDASLLLAKCYIELGELEKAKAKLEYVMVNGNKLHSVVEAGEILAKIE